MSAQVGEAVSFSREEICAQVEAALRALAPGDYESIAPCNPPGIATVDGAADESGDDEDLDDVVPFLRLRGPAGHDIEYSVDDDHIFLEFGPAIELWEYAYDEKRYGKFTQELAET